MGAAGTAGGSSAYQVLNVEGPVRAAAQKGALLWTLPWVNCYLWFLQPAEQTPAPLSPRLLMQMSQLRWAAFLQEHLLLWQLQENSRRPAVGSSPG